jgi:hypothetical protein
LYVYTETVFVNSDAYKTNCREEVKPGKHNPTIHKRHQVITRWQGGGLGIGYPAYQTDETEDFS